MIEKERVTVDFDSESYYLDGEFWESWDNYGEEMADKINDLLNEQDENLQLLIAEARYINKQRHNLVNFLKRNGHSLEDIKKIMNGDVDD